VATVCNSSPLIALASVGCLELLPPLFRTLLIPPAVAAEIAPSIPARPDWLQVRMLTRPVPDVAPALGHGEQEVLGLGVELDARRVVLDDRAARRVAVQLDLHVIGTLGVLLAAKRLRLLERVRPSMDALRKEGFFMSARLYDRVLDLADEDQP
jgi:hypothetical protein